MVARKEVDSRVPTMIRNCIQEQKRGFFVVIGDRSKDAIVNLHYMVSSFNPRHNKSVLWAYKDKLLGFTSHRKKRENKIKKEIKRGVREQNSEDPFELFVSLQNIRYVYYKETEKVLGNTYGMLILQDFEAITPNILARTVETVEGGGLVILLLHGMKSLKQIYNLSMDVHSRYRTEAYHNVVPRFNERFILSLGGCESCLVIDDEFNVLPISGGKNVTALPAPEPDEAPRGSAELKEFVEAHETVGPLIKLAKTKDQAEALVSFVDVITKKTLRYTIAMTAARGRGKSAAMGVAVAAAVSFGYSNIFVTSPSPENLKTFFEFLFKGFDALGYQDHADYSIIQSTNPSFNKAIVRVNIYKSQHRQKIQYIRPQDAHVLGQAELVVIDEAAAIPLPLVRKLMGPYLVFMASTISGYEGTGRSLSLKLIQQMREQSQVSSATADGTVEVDRTSGKATDNKHLAFQGGGRSLKEVSLNEPIRYAAGDPVEKWLNSLLCLDATLPSKSKISAHGFPGPSECLLLKVNRDTLFSFHPVSEKFLQKLVALFVSSHYKNSPDDLQLLSDAPAHELFVLVPQIEDDRLPEPLCAIQVCLEGKINRENVLKHLSRGQRPSGDLIPWLVSQQFQDNEFASLSGARVVRIATSPQHSQMGYGSRALQLLVDYYEGKFVNLAEGADVSGEQTLSRDASGGDDSIKVRDIQELPPLFAKLAESRPASLDYLGVSYGLTSSLFKFWQRASFVPLYLRQTANDLTGEYTCVQLRALEASNSDQSWLSAFANDFYRRFLSLLSYRFREFPSVLGLSLQSAASRSWPEQTAMSRQDLDASLTPFDLQRLEAYANNVLDYHVILDLMPTLAQLYFTGRMKEVQLSSLQQAILLAIGLQRKDIDDTAAELSVQPQQLLAMLVKMVRKITTHFSTLVSKTIAATIPEPSAAIGVSREDAAGVHDDEVVDNKYVPLATTLKDDLAAEGEGSDEWQKKQRELIDSLPLDQYEIEADDPAWKEADQVVSRALKAGKSVPSALSVKTKTKRKAAEAVDADGGGDQRHGKAKKKSKGHGK